MKRMEMHQLAAPPVGFDALDVPHPRPFLCAFTVTPDQIGAVIGHVSNVEYVRWLDRAAELHSASIGEDRDALRDRGVMWFVGRHEIDYRAESWLHDEIAIATWVRDIRRIKSWRDTIAWRPSDGVIVMRASTLWVYVDLESRRPIRIPDEMADRFDPLVPGRDPSCASG